MWYEFETEWRTIDVEFDNIVSVEIMSIGDARNQIRLTTINDSHIDSKNYPNYKEAIKERDRLREELKKPLAVEVKLI